MSQWRWLRWVLALCAVKARLRWKARGWWTLIEMRPARTSHPTLNFALKPLRSAASATATDAMATTAVTGTRGAAGALRTGAMAIGQEAVGAGRGTVTAAEVLGWEEVLGAVSGREWAVRLGNLTSDCVVSRQSLTNCYARAAVHMQTPDRSSADAAIGQGAINQAAIGDQEADPVDRIGADQRAVDLAEAPAVLGDLAEAALAVAALAQVLKDIAVRRTPTPVDKVARMAIAQANARKANVARTGVGSAVKMAGATGAGRAIGTLNTRRYRSTIRRRNSRLAGAGVCYPGPFLRASVFRHGVW